MVDIMKILVACEESQRVCAAFRERGHEAYSCDIQPCSGGFPQWHIMGDCVPLLDGNCRFETEDGAEHYITGRWDMIIAHPPCTYLTVAGNRWFNVERYGDKAIERARERDKAILLFLQIANADCEKIAIENPVGIISSIWRKPVQIIQPYMFGDYAEKKTCLWLKNLTPLLPTNIVEPPARVTFKSGKSMPKWYSDLWNLPKEERSRIRSKTFPGIANAMAEQWGI